MIIVIVTIFLLIYGLLVYYVSRTGWTYLQKFHRKYLKWLYILVILFMSTSFIFGRLGKGVYFLQVVGSYWMMIFALLLLILPVIHITLWVLRMTKLRHHHLQKVAGIAILITLLSCAIIGSYNAYSPVVRTYQIEIKNDALAGEQLHVVMAADLHFGLLSGINHAKRLVKEINALQPDLVLLPGDIIDDDLNIYIKRGFGNILDQIEAKYGVYASLGNHDRYHGTMEDLIAALEGEHIHILYDESITIDDRFTLVGRKDKTDANRAELAQLLEGIDPTKPIILLDHQPVELNVASALGIDLMVSGHTHRGQVFPANFITNLIFENDWGYMQKGEMHSIVTSGYGFWGPPIRLGSRSEIVEIYIQFVQE